MTLPLRILLFYVNHLKPKVDLNEVPPAKMREMNRKELQKIGAIIDAPPCKMKRVEEGAFTARDGASISYRYYQPLETGTEGKSILFFHGGGFVTRDLDSHDKACRRLAQENRMPVFSIAYRLAPEHKFPIPVHDCHDAFKWLVGAAADLGLNPELITVMGDSAGGNLATVVCLLSKQEGGITPWRQVLIYPTADARLCYPSIDSLGKGYFLTRELMEWFVMHYQSTEDDIIDPLMSPLLAEDVSGLPPAYICTADLDPLRDEGKAYAEKMAAAGVEVEFHNFQGVVHGFLNMRRLCRRQNSAMHADIVSFLSR
ncbi:alpha/beta hydrolase [Lewinella cohaerens]|uniref:alpha/beta hydrolase n=1 Tax=Lewinella cohaerens TaxID=70995 RepID=UPI00037A9CBE|nr:alpha/beta hydrolase [Lewinella cohaerens]